MHYGSRPPVPVRVAEDAVERILVNLVRNAAAGLAGSPPACRPVKDLTGSCVCAAESGMVGNDAYSLVPGTRVSVRETSADGLADVSRGPSTSAWVNGSTGCVSQTLAVPPGTADSGGLRMRDDGRAVWNSCWVTAVRRGAAMARNRFPRGAGAGGGLGRRTRRVSTPEVGTGCRSSGRCGGDRRQLARGHGAADTAEEESARRYNSRVLREHGYAKQQMARRPVARGNQVDAAGRRLRDFSAVESAEGGNGVEKRSLFLLFGTSRTATRLAAS